MTELLRIQQGPFLLEHCLKEKDWEFSKLCEGIAACSSIAGINVKELKSAFDFDSLPKCSIVLYL